MYTPFLGKCPQNRIRTKEAKKAQVAHNKSLLTGDATLRMLLNNLQGVISSVVPGADSSINSLAALGVTSGNDGKLQVDDAKVQAALTADPDSIAKLFSRTFGASGGPGLANQMLDLSGAAQQTAGPRQSLVQEMDDEVRRLADDVENKERNLAVYETNLKNQFAHLETLRSKLKSQGNYLSALRFSNRS